jgi:hypothetical protein
MRAIFEIHDANPLRAVSECIVQRLGKQCR